ncbi:hypothetical protein ACET3Z_010119 [Daucus carota]
MDLTAHLTKILERERKYQEPEEVEIAEDLNYFLIWVPLGRRDSRGASLSGSNNNIPAPNNTLQTILTKSKLQGLDIVDLEALSGSHTMGKTRCVSFRQRLYNQSGNEHPDYALDLRNSVLTA